MTKQTFSLVRDIMHDESIYENPNAFMPERFLDGNLDPRSVIFGYGRRYGLLF
jgi:cytochrome P450